MAHLVKAVFGACALASLVQAVPLRVLTITDIVTVTTWKTVNSTSTVWVSANQSRTASTTSPLVLPSSSEAAVVVTSAAVTAVTAVATSIAPSATQSLASTAASGGQFAQAPAPLPMSAFPGMNSIVPPAQPAPAAPSIFTTSAMSVAQAQPTTTPWTTSTTTAAVAPVIQTTTAAASSYGGQCAAGASCTGDVTHWDGGLGACGWNVNSASDMQVALPVGIMGSQSNGNPFCGRSVTLKNPITGTTVLATVGDKCMGCTGASIDCTNAVFNAITDGTGDGRVSGMEWWFD